MESPVETDLLIIGAGPAGLSLACFLASYGWCSSFETVIVLWSATLNEIQD